MKRALAAGLVATSIAVGACLFPSVDPLGGTGDAALDAPVETGVDAAVDVAPEAAPDAGPCDNDDPSIVAHYLFDEGSGTTIHDCSPHGFDAELTGNNAATHWTTGHTGSAVLFVPSDGVCVIVSSAQANQLGSLTVAAWITLVDPNGGYVIGQRQQSGYGWRIDVEGNDAGSDLGFAIGIGDGTGDDYSADTFVSIGAWHHVAGVLDESAGTQTLYLDGTPYAAAPAAPTIVEDPLATTIRIGCRGDDSNYFPGVIDDVRVYARAFSGSEIAALAAE